MRRSKRQRLLLGGAVCLAFLALVPSAFAATPNTINLARFSGTVSGATGTAYAGVVTVNLLRNTFNAQNVATQNIVDTCSGPASGATGAWKCTFPTHKFATAQDQVQVNYAAGTGTPANNPVTIGGGPVLASETKPPASFVTLPADSLDGTFGISSDGKTLSGSCACTFAASVDGGAALAPAGGVITFPTPVTNANSVVITGTFPSGTNTVTLTDSAPLLSVVSASDAASGATVVTNDMSIPSCTFYLDSTDAVCDHLTPGTFTINQLRGGATIASKGFAVPAQTGTSVPTHGGAQFPSVAAGDQLVLLSGAHVLSTLTVSSLKVNSVSPLTDLLNGSQQSISGICTAGELFTTGGGSGSSQLCASGTIPPTQATAGAAQGLSDETSSGQTTLDMPSIPVLAPSEHELIHTPATALSIVRQADELADALSSDAAPAAGQPVVPASTASAAPLALSIAPIGTTSFVTLGNTNTANGAAIPSLGVGTYVARYVLSDARGDTRTFDTLFVSQGGGPTVKCTAVKGSGGVQGTVAKKKKKHKKGGKGSKGGGGLTITCNPSVTGARVALWLISGHTVVASGSSIASGGTAKVVLTGTFTKGTYSLVETADVNGQSTESTQVLTIKSGGKGTGGKGHKKHHHHHKKKKKKK